MSVITRKVSLLLVTLAAGTTAVGVSIGVGQDKTPKPIPEAIPQPTPAPVASVPTLKAPELSQPTVAPPQANPAPTPAPLPSPGVEPSIAFAQQTDESKSTIRSAPFHITAPDALTARAIYHEATYLQAYIATNWIRKPYDKKQQVIINARDKADDGSSSTTFEYRNADRDPFRITVQLAGSLENILRDQLPYQMMQVILAQTFPKRLPRWIEGLAAMVEPFEEQVKQDQICRDLVNSGEAVRLKYLLPMMDYPKNTKVAFAQGHSVVRFLLTRIPHNSGSTEKLEGDALARTALLHFVSLGLPKGDWQNAARVVYGYDSIDAVEEAWLAWLHKPESVLKQPSDKAPPAHELPRVELQTIPAPANRLPGGTRKPAPTGTYPNLPDIDQPSPLVPVPLPPSNR